MFPCVGATNADFRRRILLATVLSAALSLLLCATASDCTEGRTLNTYTVVFDGNGNDGGSMEPQTINCEEDRALTDNGFTRFNYRFEGWSTTSDGEVTYADEEIVRNIAEPGAKITLFAVWTPSDIQGVTGDCTWLLHGTELTVSGSGRMADYTPDYTKGTTAPWGTVVTSVTVEDQVTYVGSYCFYGCRDLTTASLGESVQSTGAYVFWGCSNLRELNLPESLLTVSDGMCLECESLVSVELPTKIAHLGSYAFSQCFSLEEVNVPDSVSSIGNSVFYDCRSLKTIHWDCTACSIGSYTFRGCTSLTDVPFGTDARCSVGEGAFQGCTGMRLLHIGPYMTFSGRSQFSGCTSIQAVYLESDVSEWADVFGDVGKTFYNMYGKAVSRGDTLNAATYVELDGGLHAATSTGDTGDCRWAVVLSTLIVFGDGETADYSMRQLPPWYKAAGVTSVIVRESVTSVGEYAFCDSDHLSTVYLPTTITRVGAHAFANCFHLTEVQIGCDLCDWEAAFSPIGKMFVRSDGSQFIETEPLPAGLYSGDSSLVYRGMSEHDVTKTLGNTQNDLTAALALTALLAAVAAVEFVRTRR